MASVSIGVVGGWTVVSPPGIIEAVMPTCGAWGSSAFIENLGRTAFRDMVGSGKHSSDNRDCKEDGREGDHNGGGDVGYCALLEAVSPSIFIAVATKKIRLSSIDIIIGCYSPS